MLIKVLDHGYVRLVSYTQPPPMFDREHRVNFRPVEWTGDLEVVRAARVSYDAEWRTGDNVEHEAHCVSLLPPMSNGEKSHCNCRPKTRSDEKLIEYMMMNGHTSPFESIDFTFEVKAPIFIFRQWHRHRTWSYNEVSARYSELPDEYYVPRQDHIGTQDVKNRQSRTMFSSQIDDYVERDRQMRIVESFRIEAGFAHDRYRDRLGEGVPRELARLNLPLATYSRMFAKVDLHNLFHFLQLRLHPHAQWEIQQYAQALLRLISPVVPISTRVFVRLLNPSVFKLPPDIAADVSSDLKSGRSGNNPDNTRNDDDDQPRSEARLEHEGENRSQAEEDDGEAGGQPERDGSTDVDESSGGPSPSET